MMCWEGRGKTREAKNHLNKDTKEQLLCGILQIWDTSSDTVSHDEVSRPAKALVILFHSFYDRNTAGTFAPPNWKNVYWTAAWNSEEGSDSERRAVMVQQLLNKFWFSNIILLVSRSTSLLPWLKFRTHGLGKTGESQELWETCWCNQIARDTYSDEEKTSCVNGWLLYLHKQSGVKLAAGTVRGKRGQHLLQRQEQGGGSRLAVISCKHKRKEMDVKQKLKISNLEYYMLPTFYWEEFWKLSTLSVMTVFVWFIYCHPCCQQTQPNNLCPRCPFHGTLIITRRCHTRSYVITAAPECGLCLTIETVYLSLWNLRSKILPRVEQSQVSVLLQDLLRVQLFC